MFSPQEYPASGGSVLHDDSGVPWTPLYWHPCSFSKENFMQISMNLIRNPNINSNHLFRADILIEKPYEATFSHDSETEPRLVHFKNFDLETVMLRRLIPRNAQVDDPLDQTCLIYGGSDGSQKQSLVVYLPHASKPSESPFYHPAVRGIAYLHSMDSSSNSGKISIHYSFFPSGPRTQLLDRTAQHLLATVHKHGQGSAAGYVKRVHHDVILPQATVQNTYARLKAKYARNMIASWVEATDPTKHVFEDLGIAAFLIELWNEMYASGTTFPGFVDIGCGNGLLVHILLEEGYKGWGFDARRRKSWGIYSQKTQENLKEMVLIPTLVQQDNPSLDRPALEGCLNDLQLDGNTATSNIHNGEFPIGTFIISNHADELTPWTPLLAKMSDSPFIAIPCCSHNLTGAKFRAPPPKEIGASSSTYASLVAWVSDVASDCGWEVEKEMLRIPSTRNTAILGRAKNSKYRTFDADTVIQKHGGFMGWEENAMKLVKTGPRGH